MDKSHFFLFGGVKMIQCFNRRQFISSFQNNTFPHLAYSCKIDPSLNQVPRPMHTHKDAVEILLMVSGEGINVIGGQTYKNKKGDLLIYNANVLHDESPASDENGPVSYCLGITNLYYPGLEPNTIMKACSNVVYHCNEQYDDFLHLFDLIHATNLSENTFAGEFISYLLRALLIMVQKLIAEAEESMTLSVENEMHKQLKQYIDEHYMEDITLNSIANDLHLSAYYISHLFKEFEGISPMKYITRRRIGEAQILLINTNKSVTDIAFHVGYQNSNHFHSMFLKIVGLTPKNYRNYWTLKIKYQKGKETIIHL